MICDAPAQALEPPTWHMSEAGTGEPTLLLGFITFGTEEQITRLATAAEQSGLHCALPKSDDGRIEILVLFDSKTTRDFAFSFYNRVTRGEFGTTNTGLIIVPARASRKT